MTAEKTLPGGEKIRFLFRGMEMSGIVLSNDGHFLNIKLNSGYNISVAAESLQIMERVGTAFPEKPHETRNNPTAEVEIIATGGTIASRVDYVTGAVTPVLDPDILGDNIPNISSFSYEVKSIGPLLSENMTPDTWISIGRMVHEAQLKGRASIILHGTDTMSYTGSALSFMFGGLHRPVVLTGSQRSSDRPSTDAFLNMEAALEFTRTAIGEVGICMHGSTSDRDAVLLRSVRTRKMHSSRRDAFKSIGELPMAIYRDGKTEATATAAGLRDLESCNFNPDLEKKISLVYFHPLMDESEFISIAGKKKGIVIAGTGLGHVSSRFNKAIKELSGQGTKFMMTTQCINGRVNMDVYSTGRDLKSLGVIPLGNMLPETAVVKAMHVMANYPEEMFEEKMTENMRGELLTREVLI